MRINKCRDAYENLLRIFGEPDGNNYINVTMPKVLPGKIDICSIAGMRGHYGPQKVGDRTYRGINGVDEAWSDYIVWYTHEVKGSRRVVWLRFYFSPDQNDYEISESITKKYANDLEIIKTRQIVTSAIVSACVDFKLVGGTDEN